MGWIRHENKRATRLSRSFLFAFFPMHSVQFLSLFKGGDDNDRRGYIPPRIFPLRVELRRKEQAIARIQLVDLALYLIIRFPAQTKNKFVSCMRHTARTTVRVALQCKQKRFHPSDKMLTT